MFQEHLSWMMGMGTTPSYAQPLIPPPSSPWSRLQDKLFEQALVLFCDETYDRWDKIASRVPGKTPFEVKQHYDDLVHDVMEIDAGRVQLPCYADEVVMKKSWEKENRGGESQISFGTTVKVKTNEPTERKKGIPWTEEEHKLFLIGLNKYGKGDWRSISRNAVPTRTPTQVASHAQKYFLRQEASKKKEKKRSSIHDITAADNCSIPQPKTQTVVAQDNRPTPQTMQGLGPTGPFPGQGGFPGYHQQQFGYRM